MSVNKSLLIQIKEILLQVVPVPDVISNIILGYLPPINVYSANLEDFVIEWNLMTLRSLRNLIRGSNDKMTEMMTCIIVDDDKYICTGNSLGTINIWDIKTEVLLRSMQCQTSEGKNSVTSLVITYFGGKKYLCAGNTNKQVRVFDFETCKNVRSFNTRRDDTGTGITTLINGPPGFIYSGDSSGNIKKLNLINQKSEDFSNLKDSITSLVFVSSEKIYSGDSGGNIYIWDTNTGHLIKNLKHSSVGIVNMLLTKDKHLWVGKSNGSIEIWKIDDKNNGKVVKSLQFKDNLTSLVMTSYYICAANKSQAIGLFNIDKMQYDHELILPSNRLNRPTFLATT